MPGTEPNWAWAFPVSVKARVTARIARQAARHDVINGFFMILLRDVEGLN
jgi:hypothetical protein